MIVIPLDGSDISLESLNYTNRIFGPDHNLKVLLFHALPSLPPFLIEESKKDVGTAQKLRDLQKKHAVLAGRLLASAKNKLIKMGFAEESVETFHQDRRVGIARDICNWAEEQQADAIVISSRGRSRIEAFFTGEVANKVLEYARVCPIWMVKGSVKNGNVLLAVDHSENALRAVDHCGFMFSGTDANVTVFHAKRDLKRFIPKEVAEEFPELKKFWQHKAGDVVAPYLQKSKEMLLEAGLTERQISLKVIDGGRNPARDILDEARSSGIGAVVLGKRGYSNVKEFSMGSISKKILDQASDMTVCIVP
jgi:nucleotide-binding universal stress UspA family protein